MSTEDEIVYIPMSTNQHVQKDLGLTSGTADLEIIDPGYGVALKVEFNGVVELKGTYKTTDRIRDRHLSMIQSQGDYNSAYYNIYYQANDNLTYRCSASIKLAYSDYESYDADGVGTELNPGWNVYEGFISTNYYRMP